MSPDFEDLHQFQLKFINKFLPFLVRQEGGLGGSQDAFLKLWLAQIHIFADTVIFIRQGDLGNGWIVAADGDIYPSCSIFIKGCFVEAGVTPVW